MKRRDEIKNEYPNFNATDITELLGKEWRNLSEKDKNFYQEEFTKKYEHYKKELKDYYESKGIDPSTIKSEKKKVYTLLRQKKKGEIDSVVEDAELGKRGNFIDATEEDDDNDEGEEENADDGSEASVNPSGNAA